jgi:hypothetical protein
MPRPESEPNQPEPGYSYFLILPERVAKRIQRHYRGTIPPRVLRPFWRKMNRDLRYQQRVFRKVDQILKVMLDATTTDVGRWPRGLRETLGVFALVGYGLETAVEEMLLQIPEEELAVWEEKVVLLHIQELKHKGE